MSSPLARLSRFVLAGLLLAVPAFAQYSQPLCANGKNNTTITGRVFSPNGIDPLPDVLVYVPGPAGAVAIPDGVSTADLRPVNPLTETTTSYDGSFTLNDAPAGSAIPLVLQSGKWQRQLVIATAIACQDNVLVDPTGDRFARFPRNKSEGYIPRIAIVTGSVESTECILRKVGIDDAEFTNFTDGGRINFFLGSKRAGSAINSSTPGELALMNDATQMNAFDLLLFPCQGSDQTVTTAGQTNLVNFANTGGRVFANHHSHAWIRDNPGFANVFNFGTLDQVNAPDGAATVDQSFTIGATMALWLQNLGQTTKQGQVGVTNVFATLKSITPNAQQWISLNSNSLPIQASFDTPIGAPAIGSYGRVLYNEYHVSPANSNGTLFPKECSGSAMSQQEKMLEFSLFDLSSFAAIVKTDCTMGLTGTPNPAKLGTPINMTATVAIPAGSTYSTPTGAVTFSEGSTVFGTVVVHSGIATTPLTGLATGSHIITALYSGDPYYKAQSVTTTVVVNPPATVSVVASPNPGFTGHASTISFTATGSSVSPIPTGTVSITVDGVTTTLPLSGGAAALPARIYTNGAHPITAVYNGDATYDPQTATTTLYVQVSSTTSLGEAAPAVFLLNPAVFTAKVSGVADVQPTGTMTFTDGATTLAVVNVTQGVTVLSLTNLAFGKHTISAVYSGDNYYGPSSSTSVVENVMDYAVTVTQTDLTINHSTVAIYTFTVAPLGGPVMPADITLSLTGLRPQSVLTMSPAVITAGSGLTTVTATIKTSTAPSSPPDLLKMSFLKAGVGGLAFGLLLLPFTVRGRRRLQRALLILLLTAGLSVALTGCGTGWKTLDYRLQLMTNSGPLTHQTALSLTEIGGK